MEPARTTLGYIREATAADAAAITELRLTAYISAPEFSLVETETLRWGMADEENIVLAAWDAGGQLLSTTRGEVYPDRYAAEKAMELSLDGCDVEFPALLLGKGATRHGYGRHGLHSALRLHFLQALPNTGVRTVLGIVYPNAPRTRLMERIGYEFIQPKQVWYTDLSPFGPTMLGFLKYDRLALACDQLQVELSDVLSQYPFTGQELSTRVIEVLAAGCAPMHPFAGEQRG